MTNTITNNASSNSTEGQEAIQPSIGSAGVKKMVWIYPILIVITLLVFASLAAVKLYQRHKQERQGDSENHSASYISAVVDSKSGGVEAEQKRKLGASGTDESRVPGIINDGDRKPQSAVPARAGYGGENKDPDDAPLTFTSGGSGGLGLGSGGFSGSAGSGGENAGRPASQKKDYTNIGAFPGLPAGYGGKSSEPSNSGVNLESTKTPGMRAKFLGDRNFILAKGEMIDCVLNTALMTTVSGMSSCTVTKNIYSDNGKVVLVERGSIVTGEYRAEVKQGQSRIAVLWNRVRTPNGVIIDLDSPGGDSLGRGGLDGDVDNHWGQRLGAAFMLSFVQDAIAYQAAVHAPAGNGPSYFQNTQATGNQMADTILKQTINIPPTITRDQGTRLSIFIARDLDFTPVYQLRLSN